MRRSPSIGRASRAPEQSTWGAEHHDGSTTAVPILLLAPRTLEELTAPMGPLGSQTCTHRRLIISFNPPAHSGYVHHDGNYHRGAGFWAPSQAAT